MKNKLVRDPGSANGSYLDSTFLALFCNLTPALALVSTLILASVPAAAPALPFSDKLFR